MRSNSRIYLGTDDLLDRKLSFAVCFQVTVVGIKNELVQAIPILYRYSNVLNMALLVILMGIYGYAVFKSGRRFVHMRATSFVVLLFVILSFIRSPLSSRNNIPVMLEWLPRFLPFCILTYLLLSELRSTYWIEYYMTRFCYAIVFFAMVSALFIYRNGHIASSDWNTYSMPLSYATLTGVMWLMYRYFKFGKWYDVLMALAGIAVIVMYGSRNPLLAIGAYFVVQLFRSVVASNASSWKKMLCVILILFLIVAVIRMDLIINLLIQILSLFNVSSRTLNLLAESTADFTSGRDVIHSAIFARLSRNPFIGLGVGGDVGIVGDLSHGLFMSLLSTYGLLFGPVVILVMLWFVLKGYRKASPFTREIVLLYICLVLPRAFTSIDVWSYDVFWWMLGVCAVAVNASPLMERLQMLRTALQE